MEVYNERMGFGDKHSQNERRGSASPSDLNGFCYDLERRKKQSDESELMIMIERLFFGGGKKRRTTSHRGSALSFSPP